MVVRLTQMVALTSIVALFFALVASSRKYAGTSLAVLIASTLLWPEYLRIPLFIQVSVPRLVAFFLIIKFSSKYKIRYNKVDFYVIGVWLWTIFAVIIAGSEMTHITQMIGRGLDTLLVYFVARKAFSNTENIKSLFPIVAFTAIFMCVMGVYEAITWHSPYHKFYFSLGYTDRSVGYSEVRHGMLRAQGSTLVSIYFGMAMMLITGFIWSLKGYVKKNSHYLISFFCAILATVSCLSSGPWIALAGFFFLLLYFKKTSFIKPSIITLLLLCFAIEFASNRHFYNLIDYIALDKQTAWYRTRLLEVAVSQWRDFWLVGVGSNWPHHWASLLDGRQHIDIVNNFLIVAIYGGLPAMFMYILSHVNAIKMAINVYHNNLNTESKRLLFGLCATLIAFDFASFSVAVFGPALMLSYILLGMLVSIASNIKLALNSLD